MSCKIALAFILVLISAFSCRKSVSANQNTIIKLNECFQGESGNMNLCFEAVVEDSRCPQKVECIWQGRAVAKFTLMANNHKHSFSLIANAAMPGYAQDTLLEGYKIQFINLYPYPGDPSTSIEAEVKISQ